MFLSTVPLTAKAMTKAQGTNSAYRLLRFVKPDNLLKLHVFLLRALAGFMSIF